MQLTFFSLGSGSCGNCYYLATESDAIIIDCGIGIRRFKKHMLEYGMKIGKVRALLITHDHSDHCKGAASFRKRHPSVPFFANGDTADAIASVSGVEDGWNVFETAVPFRIGGIEVTPFSVPHDAADPVGYLFDDGASVFFLGTDMGVATVPVKAAFARARCAVLESNHDPELLARSDRPVSLKQRIAGRCGHLSNADAAAVVRETAPAGLKTLLPGHLSRQCNAPHLALEEMRAALADIGRTDVELAALEQDSPCGPYEF